MSLADWPADASVSPYRLVPWRQACADLDCNTSTLEKLLAQHDIDIVNVSTRKRAVLARDLVTLVVKLKEARHV